jgi:aryl-alcohol dehydrogenase-like predicted oxidoreductase
MASIDASLDPAGTDHVDLYQIHRWNDEAPIEEIMRALHEVVYAGNVRHMGASGMYAWQFAKAQHIAAAAGWTRFASMQNRDNLVYRPEMIPPLRGSGHGSDHWSPQACAARWYS